MDNTSIGNKHVFCVISLYLLLLLLFNLNDPTEISLQSTLICSINKCCVLLTKFTIKVSCHSVKMETKCFRIVSHFHAQYIDIVSHAFQMIWIWLITHIHRSSRLSRSEWFESVWNVLCNKWIMRYIMSPVSSIKFPVQIAIHDVDVIASARGREWESRCVVLFREGKKSHWNRSMAQKSARVAQ